MQIKTFEAKSMNEALKRVKQDFGPDAVILSARTLKRKSGLLRPWTKRRVEVTAYKEPTLGAPPDGAGPPPHGPVSIISPAPQRSRITDRRPTRALAGPVISPLPRGYLKNLFCIYQQLLWQAVDPHVAFSLVESVHQTAFGAGCHQAEDLKVLLEQYLHRCVGADAVSGAEPIWPRGMILVGPTGVGKTTTVAKLAAFCAHEKNMSVGLVSLDDQRIGGLAQLNIYANIIDVPLESASTPKQFQQAITNLSQKQIIFVDTAGCHPRQSTKLTQLNELLAVDASLQVHLVLGAGTGSGDLSEIIEGFAPAAVHKAIVTKLDEAATRGCLLNVSLQHRLPLSYWCGGQQVPEDVARASAAGLVNLLLDPALERRVWAEDAELLARRLDVFEGQLRQAAAGNADWRSTEVGGFPVFSQRSIPDNRR
jgi:flagellar biosynthesis protein FlhF